MPLQSFQKRLHRETPNIVFCIFPCCQSTLDVLDQRHACEDLQELVSLMMLIKTHESQRSLTTQPRLLQSVKTKMGTAKRERQKKNSRQFARNVTTIYDILRQSAPWPPNSMQPRNFLREEQTKCKAYGQKNGYNLQAFDKGMTPVVPEQFGRTAPGAQAIFNRIINHRLQLLVRQGMPFSYAKTIASSKLWGPISSTLLRAAWQAHAECTPKIGPAHLSGFRKRGRRNGVASDFFRFFPFSSVFFPFFSVFSSVFFPFSSVFFRFLPFFSVFFRFFPFHFQKKTGRHRSRDPFCETPNLGDTPSSLPSSPGESQ